MTNIESFFAKCAAEDPCFLKTVFVFPSQIPADLWVNRLIAHHVCSTIPADRFISWDAFKESAVKARQNGLSPVSAVVRKLYAGYEASQNVVAASNGSPLFSDLIPVSFAADSAIFVDWLAGLLPQLGTWNRYMAVCGLGAGGAEDADLAALFERYRSFLSANGLFEPSWELPDLQDNGYHYYVLFPHTIDDFDEYESILKKSPAVSFVEFDGAGSVPITVYENTRQEISAVVSEIRRLVSGTGVLFSDIAVSVPDLENTAPYLLRELRLYDIPYRFRVGGTLGELPGGNMFRLIQDCVSSRFSFESVKSLLLNRQIPWKSRDGAEKIVEAGIRLHCVTSWKNDGSYVDIWESALRSAAVTPSDTALCDWFSGLRYCLSAMVAAVSFADIRRQYFVFKEKYLDKDLFTEDCDRVVSRCIEELSGLIDIESCYGSICPAARFAFFVSHLQNKQYVAQSNDSGISIFPYKVAAGVPVAYHFILDTTQELTTVLYGSLRFLRTDMRHKLGVPLESDVSAAFFNAYKAGADELRLSCSIQTMAGYATPHSFFAGTQKVGVYYPQADSFECESSLFYPNGQNGGSAALDDATSDSVVLCDAASDALFSAKKIGFERWYKRYDAQRNTVENTCMDKAVIAPLVANEQITSGDDIKISATRLAAFDKCPLKWYYGTLLNLREFNLDSALIDDRNIGSIVHLALKELFERIKATSPGGCFYCDSADAYLAMVPDCVQAAFDAQQDFSGPLAKPLLEGLFERVSEAVRAGVLYEASQESCDGLYVSLLETHLEVRRDGMLFNGIIDRVSTAPDGEAIILDYKTGSASVPAIKNCSATPTGELHEFQIPMYIFLTENAATSPYQNTQVSSAGFFKISTETKITYIVGDKKIPRSEFDTTMDAFLKVAIHMRDSVRNGDFTITKNEPSYDDCSGCNYKMVCRHLYKA